VVLNRKGRSVLLACGACGELARCERCEGAVQQVDDGGGAVLRCRRCAASRPTVCARCGATTMKNLRVGVTRAREELEALLRRPVVEVTGATARTDLADAACYVGTEAVLHQVRGVDVVAFLELDQELLAPRYRAAEEAFGLIVRAARLVGRRDRGGRVVLQTRLAEHEVVQAAVRADPDLVRAAEAQRREVLGWPPAVAMAAVSGESARAYIDAVRAAGADVEVLGPAGDRWLLRATTHATLCDALAAVPRPPGRLRIEVDPLRV
jgi:primosomal protein N' (replication factor Y)